MIVWFIIYFLLITVKPRRGRNSRTWTNEDLKNALEAVKTKQMNTSQASKTFGIPYNSLLMYVHGKYGKTINIDLPPSQTVSTTKSQEEMPQDLRTTVEQMPTAAAYYGTPAFLQYTDQFPLHAAQVAQHLIMSSTNTETSYK